MTIYLLILWITGITSFTLLGSWYAKKFNKPDLLIALYVTFVLSAQILAVKISEFDLGFKTFFVPSGILVFSITYLLTDIVNEKFGRKETQNLLIAGLNQKTKDFIQSRIIIAPARTPSKSNSTQILLLKRGTKLFLWKRNTMRTRM